MREVYKHGMFGTKETEQKPQTPEEVAQELIAAARLPKTPENEALLADLVQRVCEAAKREAAPQKSRRSFSVKKGRSGS